MAFENLASSDPSNMESGLSARSERTGRLMALTNFVDVLVPPFGVSVEGMSELQVPDPVEEARTAATVAALQAIEAIAKDTPREFGIA